MPASCSCEHATGTSKAGAGPICAIDSARSSRRRVARLSHALRSTSFAAFPQACFRGLEDPSIWRAISSVRVASESLPCRSMSPPPTSSRLAARAPPIARSKLSSLAALNCGASRSAQPQTAQASCACRSSSNAMASNAALTVGSTARFAASLASRAASVSPTQPSSTFAQTTVRRSVGNPAEMASS